MSRGTKGHVDSFINSSFYLKCVYFCHTGNSSHKQEYVRSLNEGTDRPSEDRMIFERGQRWTFSTKSNDVL